MNTVGSPYFAAANAAMGHGGRQILMSTRERPVPFDIFTFYRGRHSFFGIDTLALDASQSAAVLRELLPGFASGQLRPFPMRGRLLPSTRRWTLTTPCWTARATGWCCGCSPIVLVLYQTPWR